MVKELFYAIASDFRRNIAFWKVRGTSPVCPSGKNNVYS